VTAAGLVEAGDCVVVARRRNTAAGDLEPRYSSDGAEMSGDDVAAAAADDENDDVYDQSATTMT